ncbi:MAG: FkbM family methyltransferase [Anaerolineaceae bacterium]|jgi:FkbM family methyltransferase
MRKQLYYFKSIFTLLGGIKNWTEVIRLFLQRGKGSPMLLRLKTPKLEVQVRGKMDAWSVKETLLDRLYQKYGCEVQPGWIVVDIGAAIGEFPLEVASIACKVFAFEPNPESLSILRENMRRNGINNVDSYPLGVWNSAGRMQLSLPQGEPLQAQTVENDSSAAQQESFETVTLGDVVEDYVRGKVDLLKMDCEGAEYPILLNTGTEILAKIDRVIMEYHDLDNERNHAVLHAFFEAKGYKVRRTENPVHSNIGYLFAWRGSLNE